MAQSVDGISLAKIRNSRMYRFFCYWLVVWMVLPAAAWANPSGEGVVAGTVSLTRGEKALTVSQGSDRAIIDWQDFSIGAGEVTRFNLTDASCATLNRVVSDTPSALFGKLTSNGRLFLINRNGILVGDSGVIDTHGFLASTLEVDNDAFLAGGDLSFVGDSDAPVQNLGTIQAHGGDLFLIARHIGNGGTLSAKNGTVGLAAGSEVLLRVRGSERLFIRAGADLASLENGGLIDAATAELKAVAGNAYALAINNEGAVRANAVEKRGGQIWLVAETGTTANSGALTATQGDTGGEVRVLGDRVALTGEAFVDASGAKGGGTVLVGGDVRGKNPAVKNAGKTFVGSDVCLAADALTEGDGGTVVVWSDEATQFYGALSARGGADAGNGGFAEVSGKKGLRYLGRTDVTAPGGGTGRLLLDPRNITIQKGSGEPALDEDGGTPELEASFTATLDESILSTTTLQTALETANVTVSTGGDGSQDGIITVNSPIGWFSDKALTLDAAGGIAINANITATDGALALKGGTGAITLSQGAQVRLYTGALTATAGGAISDGDGAFRVGSTAQFVSTGGDLLLDSTENSFTGAVSAISAEAGAITLANDRALSLGTVTAGTGGLALSAAGSMTCSHLLTAGGVASLTTSAANGSITLDGGLALAGPLSLTAHGLGSVTLTHVGQALAVGDVVFGGDFTLSSDDALSLGTVSGRGTGTVAITGSAITATGEVVTHGGNVSLTATGGAMETQAITTKATAHTGTASGTLTLSGAGDVTTGALSTRGADNNAGVGSNAAEIKVSAAGALSVGAVIASGGNSIVDAGVAASPDRNGGNAASITLDGDTDNTGGETLTLNGDLSAIGGTGVKGGGATTALNSKGLGGKISVQGNGLLTRDLTVSTGQTNGDVAFTGSLNSDGTARSLAIEAGVGSVRLTGDFGKATALKSVNIQSSQASTLSGWVQTDSSAGITVHADGDVHLKGTLHTETDDGLVSFANDGEVFLDGGLTLTRGGGAITFPRGVYSQDGARYNLTFDGSGAGNITVGEGLGGSSLASALGDIHLTHVGNLSVAGAITAQSLQVDSGGTLTLSGSQSYDGANGFFVTTSEDFILYGDIRLSHDAADFSLVTSGAISGSSWARPDLSTIHGNLTLNAAGSLDLASGRGTLTAHGGAITLTGAGVTLGAENTVNAGTGAVEVRGGSGALSLAGNMTGQGISLTGEGITVGPGLAYQAAPTQFVNAGDGAIVIDAGAKALTVNGNMTAHGISLKGTGLTQTHLYDSSSSVYRAGTLHAGDGKIRVDGKGGAVALYGDLLTTDADTGGTPAVLIHNANGVTVSGVNAQNGTLRIGEPAGDPASPDVTGSVRQYDRAIDINTLEVNASGSLSLTSASNVIDTLGDFSLGGALEVCASGRTTGMALTGNIAATQVTLKTGKGPLALGDKTVTATTGNVWLQGLGVTQDADAPSISSAGTITVCGNDYNQYWNKGAVVLADTLTTGQAVTIANTTALTLANITVGSRGSRGTLSLGGVGAVTQKEGTALKVGTLSITSSGAITLTRAGNEIQTLDTLSRGGDLAIVDADTEANGLSLSGNLGGGSTSSAVSLQTAGPLALNARNVYGSRVTLESRGLTSSGGGVYANYGAGDLVVDAGGAEVSLWGSLQATGSGSDHLVIKNAADVSLGSVYVNTGPGAVALGMAEAPITGNVTQNTSYVRAGTLTGDVGGAVTLTQGNEVFGVGDFRAGRGFCLNASKVPLSVTGALAVAEGDVTLGTTGAGDHLTVAQGGAISASPTGDGAVCLSTADTRADITVTGAVSAGSGGLTANAGGRLALPGTLETTGGVRLLTRTTDTGYTQGLILGGTIRAGADGIGLHSGAGITQTGGSLLTSGALYGLASNNTASVSKYTPSARGAVGLDGTNAVGQLGSFYLLDPSGAGFVFADTAGGLALTGNLTNAYGDITVRTAGDILSLGSAVLSAGASGTQGADVALTGRGITQGNGIISVNGIADEDGMITGGTMVLTGYDGSGAGSLNMSGTLTTFNDSEAAITFQGTTDLSLPTIEAPKGTLVVGRNDLGTPGAITGKVTQGADTAIHAEALTVAAQGSVVLNRPGNAVSFLGTVTVGDDPELGYDFDLADSDGGLTLTGDVTSAGGVRLTTRKGAGEAGALALAARQVLAQGDICLAGQGVAQAAGSFVNADYAGGVLGDGGAIFVDGGGAALSLLGHVLTDNTSDHAVALVNGTDAVLNLVTATGGTLVLGRAEQPLSGSVTQQAGGALSVNTLAGSLGTLALTTHVHADNLGELTTTGALTLADTGGGVAGLAFTGDVTSGGTVTLSSGDGVLNLGDHTLDATGQVLILSGLGISQAYTPESGASGSALLATRASLNGGAGSIRLGSAQNDFTGNVDHTLKVSLACTGEEVVIRDANDLCLSALEGPIGDATSVTALAGGTLTLTREALTTTTGHLDFRSLSGDLSAPGKVTTGSGNVTLVATGTLTLLNSVASQSGDIAADGGNIVHVAGAGYSLATGGDGTIAVEARTGNLTQGLDFSYTTEAGAITLTALAGQVNLADISSADGTLAVSSGGAIVQQKNTALKVAGVAAKALNDGGIDLDSAENEIEAVSLCSRNADDTATGGGAIGLINGGGVAVRRIETGGTATLTADGAVTTDAVHGPGTVVADSLRVKTLSDAGAGIFLTAANHVGTLDARVRNLRDTADADGGIRFTDTDGFGIASLRTAGDAVLTSGGAVTQQGAIRASGLGLAGTGSFALHATDSGVSVNKVGTFASEATGDVDFSTALALTVGTVGTEHAIRGIATGGADMAMTALGLDASAVFMDTQGALPGTAGGALSLTTTGSGPQGNLTVGAVDTSGQAAADGSRVGGDAGAVTLTAGGEALALVGALTARGGAGGSRAGAHGRVCLTAATGAVTQADSGQGVRAGALIVNGAHTSRLLDTQNQVDTLAATLTADAAGFTFHNQGAIRVGVTDGELLGLTTRGGAVALSSENGGVTLAAPVLTSGGAFTSAGTELTSLGGATLATGGGDVDVSGHTGAVTFGAAVSTAGGAFTAMNLRAFDSGVTRVSTAGGTDEAGGAIAITATGDVTLGEVVADAGADSNGSGESAGGVEISAGGTVTAAGVSAAGTDHHTDSAIGGKGGRVLLDGARVILTGDILTAGGGAGATTAQGGEIRVAGPAVIAGDVALATGDGCGDISFSGSVESADGSAHHLTLGAGRGSVAFAGALGEERPLGTLTIASAKDLTLASELTAAHFIQAAGTGTTALGGPVVLSGDLAFTGRNLTLGGAVTAGGAVAVSNAGTLAAGAITASGGFSQTGSGATGLSGTLTAGGGGISFASEVQVLADNLALDAGTGTLGFGAALAAGEHAVSLIADKIDFTAKTTGTGAWTLGAASADRDVRIGGAADSGAVLDLTAEELALLPTTLAGLTVGRSGSLGALSIGAGAELPTLALSLHAGGGITQTGSLKTAALALDAGSAAIDLSHPGNVFGDVALSGSPSDVALFEADAVTQASAWRLGNAGLSVNAGAYDVTLTQAGNTFGALELTGGRIALTESAETTLGEVRADSLAVASAGALCLNGAVATTGDLRLSAEGPITQGSLAPMSVGGDLFATTRADAGHVAFNNSGGAATRLGDTRAGGNFTLTSAGAVTQALGTSLLVVGDLNATGATLELSGTGNLIGGETGVHSTDPTQGDSVVLRLPGLIALDAKDVKGNLTVVSQASNRSFDGAAMAGEAISLNHSQNNVAGTVSLTTAAPEVVAGAEVQTGITQKAGTTLTVGGLASFTAEASSEADSGVISLANTGNRFGSLYLCGEEVTVRQDTGPVDLVGATVTGALDVTSGAGVTQRGALAAAHLTLAAQGAITLENPENRVGLFTATSGGNPVAFRDKDGLVLGGIAAGGADLALTTGGDLTQTGALTGVNTLTLASGGGVDLAEGGLANEVGALAGLDANGSVSLADAAGGLRVSGAVASQAGSVVLVTDGDLTLADGARVTVTGAADIELSATGAFTLDAPEGAASPFTLGTGRFLVFSHNNVEDTPGDIRPDSCLVNMTYAADRGDARIEDGKSYFVYGTPATLRVVAQDTHRGYGEANAGLSYTLEGLLFGHTEADALSGPLALASSATVGSGAGGTYAITFSNKEAITSPSNYTLAFVDGTLTIDKASLTVTARDAGKVFDGTAWRGGDGVRCSGFKNGETLADLAGTLAFGGSSQGAVNAGSYLIAPEGLASANYDISFADGTLTVDQAPLVVTTRDVTKVYDGSLWADGSLRLVTGALYGSATLSGGAFAFADANAGTGKVVRTSGVTVRDGNGGANYALRYADNTACTITPAPITVASSKVVKGYDGTAGAVGTATLVAGTLYHNASNGGAKDTLAGGSFAFADANAGTGKAVHATGVTVTDGNGGGNYAITHADNTQGVIEKAPITLSSTAVTKTYDGTLAAPGTATLVAGTLFGSDALAGGTFAFADADAGTGKRVTVSGVTVSDGNQGRNYAVTCVANTASVIEKAAISVSGGRVVKTYDGSPAASGAPTLVSGTLYANASHGGRQDTLSGGSFWFTDPGAGTGKVVKAAGVTVSDGNGGGNYRVTCVDNTTSQIRKAPLTVVAHDAAKAYDAEAWAGGNGVSYNGFVGSDGTDDLTGTLGFGGSAQGAVNAGSYGITPQGLTAANYDVAFLGGTLEVAKAPLVITARDAQKTYDGRAYTGGNGVAYQGFVGGEGPGALDGRLAYGGTSQGAVNAGVYGVVPMGLGSGNYAVTYRAGTLAVAKAPLTLAAHNQSRPFDEANPPLTCGATGLVPGDELSSLTGLRTWTPAGIASLPGAYPIVLSGTDRNYDLTFVPGTLTVTQAIFALGEVTTPPVSVAGQPLVGGGFGVIAVDQTPTLVRKEGADVSVEAALGHAMGAEMARGGTDTGQMGLPAFVYDVGTGFSDDAGAQGLGVPAVAAESSFTLFGAGEFQQGRPGYRKMDSDQETYLNER